MLNKNIFDKASKDFNNIYFKNVPKIIIKTGKLKKKIRANIYYGKDVQNIIEAGDIPQYKISFSTLEFDYDLLNENTEIFYKNKGFLIAKKEHDETLKLALITLKEKESEVINYSGAKKP